MSFLILADDLTGAADCAARCRGAGIQATIALGAPTPPLPLGATAFTSDSRHLPAPLAAQRVRDLVNGLRTLAGVTWYKKIDSTLRGNLGAELDAMLETLGRDHALICPAFPAQGRGLHNGFLRSQVPQARPVHLPTLLNEQSQHTVELITLEHVRAGTASLADHLNTAGRRAHLLVADAMTDDDLQIMLEAAQLVLPDALRCGSAGLVGALARSHCSVEQATPPRIPAGPTLLVVGSGSAMARRQIAHLRQHTSVMAIAIDQPTTKPNGRWAMSHGSITRRPLPDRPQPAITDVLLHLPDPAPGEQLDGPEARTCAERLAAAAVPMIDQIRPALLVLVGGDTAYHVLDRLGVARLEVLHELLPGMPLARGLDAVGREHMVILKAGNHGNEATLTTLLQVANKAQCNMEQAD